jgi:hypothetical protein
VVARSCLATAEPAVVVRLLVLSAVYWAVVLSLLYLLRRPKRRTPGQP